MKKLIIAFSLFGCIKQPEITYSDYECETMVIFYESINNNPLFQYPLDTSYSYDYYTIADTAINEYMYRVESCIEMSDTSTYTVPTSNVTSRSTTSVIISNWNKL